MSLYLAAYDIADDRRRARVGRFLLEFGARVQRSVYEVGLDPDEIPDFRREVGALLARHDRFLLVPIDERGERASISWQQPLDRFEPVTVI